MHKGWLTSVFGTLLNTKSVKTDSQSFPVRIHLNFFVFKCSRSFTITGCAMYHLMSQRCTKRQSHHISPHPETRRRVTACKTVLTFQDGLNKSVYQVYAVVPAAAATGQCFSAVFLSPISNVKGLS